MIFNKLIKVTLALTICNFSFGQGFDMGGPAPKKKEKKRQKQSKIIGQHFYLTFYFATFIEFVQRSILVKKLFVYPADRHTINLINYVGSMIILSPGYNSHPLSLNPFTARPKTVSLCFVCF